MERKEATIRKWYGTWGVAHSYASPDTPPAKFFIHVKNQKFVDAVLGVGVRIAFVQGDPRTPHEMPVALEIDIVPMPPAMVKASKSVAKPTAQPMATPAEVNPSSEVKQ